MAISSNSDVQVTDNHLLLYPKEQKITKEDLQSMINQNEDWAKEYHENWSLYVGEHDILSAAKKIFGPDNRLVVNMPHYIVDTFNGYFMGNPPKITLPDKGQNQSLQDWNDSNSLQDRLNEVSKQADLYGRSFLFFYQDEDAETNVAVVSPQKAFMVYDDTVAQRPLAFITYAKDRKGKSQWLGNIYYATKTIAFGDELGEETPNP
ncbi:MAG: phage portal protein, partial [Ligilactobacillus murinus]|nr:phage portal protein [Ligilactobacillus murinus]